MSKPLNPLQLCLLSLCCFFSWVYASETKEETFRYQMQISINELSEHQDFSWSFHFMDLKNKVKVEAKWEGAGEVSLQKVYKTPHMLRKKKLRKLREIQKLKKTNSKSEIKVSYELSQRTSKWKLTNRGAPIRNLVILIKSDDVPSEITSKLLVENEYLTTNSLDRRKYEIQLSQSPTFLKTTYPQGSDIVEKNRADDKGWYLTILYKMQSGNRKVAKVYIEP